MASHSSPQARPTDHSTDGSACELTTRLRHAFLAADRDRNGTLSKRELYHALALVGLHYTASEQLRVWEVCANSCGTMDHVIRGVDWSHFLALATGLLKQAFGGGSSSQAKATPTLPKWSRPAWRQREQQQELWGLRICSEHQTQVRRALAQRQRVGVYMGYPPPAYPSNPRL